MCKEETGLSHSEMCYSEPDCEAPMLTMVTFSEEGKKQINGGHDLKDSQEYPLPFGFGMGSLCFEHKSEVAEKYFMRVAESDQEITVEGLLYDTDRWPDADLELVYAYLFKCVLLRWG